MHQIKTPFIALLLGTVMLLTTGCLNPEFKEYRYNIKPDGSGTGSITFINITSSGGKEEEASFDYLLGPEDTTVTRQPPDTELTPTTEDSVIPGESDFNTLINDYLQGNNFETENPQYRVTGKKLYEANGALVGKVEFAFNSIDSVGFYRDDACPKSSYIHFFPADLIGEETVIATNGKYLGENSLLPLVVFKPGLSDYWIKTQSREQAKDGTPLLQFYLKWKKSGSVK